MGDNCTICPFVQYWYIFVALLVVIWAGMKFFQSRSTTSSSDQAADSPSILNLNDDNFNASTAEGVIMIDFWASWCGPCQRQGQIINEMIDTLPEGAKIAKVNVDESKGLAEKFKISGIPAWIVFQDGKEVERLTGLQTAEQLRTLAKKYVSAE